jgi:hypothetical protein
LIAKENARFFNVVQARRARRVESRRVSLSSPSFGQGILQKGTKGIDSKIHETANKAIQGAAKARDESAEIIRKSGTAVRGVEARAGALAAEVGDRMQETAETAGHHIRQMADKAVHAAHETTQKMAHAVKETVTKAEHRAQAFTDKVGNKIKGR